MTETVETCGNCGERYIEWEMEIGEMQPPNMPHGPICRRCWNEIADQKYKEIEEDEAACDAQTDTCGNCGEEIEEWEMEIGEMQPPNMPHGPMCRPCWDEAAARIWKEIEEDEAASEAAMIRRAEQRSAEASS